MILHALTLILTSLSNLASGRVGRELAPTLPDSIVIWLWHLLIFDILDPTTESTTEVTTAGGDNSTTSSQTVVSQESVVANATQPGPKQGII